MKKDKIIKFLFIVIMIGVIVAVGYYVSRLSMTSLESHEFYQYVLGRKIEYTGELEISKGSNSVSSMNLGNNTSVELDSTPLYYKNEDNKMLLPKDMAVVLPLEQNAMKKVNRLSTVEIGKDNYIRIKYENEEFLEKNGFLFDGNDLYIFLDWTEITIGEQTYNLAPMSYAIVHYRQSVEIYQKQDDKYHMLEEVKDGNITAKHELFEINLSTDAFKCDTKEQLILKKIDVLPKLFENV